MSATLVQPEPRLRIVSRRSSCKTVRVSIRPTRPSLLDYRLRGDAWVVALGGHTAGVFFDCCRLLTVGAVPLDWAALNSRLHALRHRQPRRRC
jgi:hypothetical protein